MIRKEDMKKMETKDLLIELFDESQLIFDYLVNNSSSINDELLYSDDQDMKKNEKNNLEKMSFIILNKIKLMMEIVKRLQIKKDDNSSDIGINSSRDIYNIYRDIKDTYKKDIIHVVLLNVNSEIISMKKIKINNFLFKDFDDKKLFYILLKKKVNRFVFVHYREPNEKVNPTIAEIHFTSKINKKSNFLGFKMLDHLIIGEGEYFSYQEQGLL